MIYANCEVYENDKEEIGVLTRTDDNNVQTFLINDNDPNDLSVNFDKRLIEFFLAYPDATYEAWDKLLAECGYDFSIFDQEFPNAREMGKYGDPRYVEIWDHYSEPVRGFEVTYVPKGMLVRISNETVRNQYGDYKGEKQIVLVYSKEDFIET